jgi:ATP-dependent 26S proteasome regulatory subunit
MELLDELDGFDELEYVKIIVVINRWDIVDNGLLWDGCFD